MKLIAGIAFFMAMPFAFVDTSQTLKVSDSRQLLPSASEFRLTLAEDRHSKLPPGPSCTGEAAKTLTCRAFTVTLENLSKKTVRISWTGCNEPEIRIDRKLPNSSNAWFPVSSVQRETCRPMTWTSVRLKPGEKNTYATRLISPRRYAERFEPGSYTLRAEWLLFGCIEEPEGNDWLGPLQVAHPPSIASDFAFQTPVSVISNEVTVDAPVLRDLGQLKLTFDVSVRPGPPPASYAKTSVDCTGDASESIDCIVFHYAIHNLGRRPIRHGGFTCEGFGIGAEYRLVQGEWQPVLPNAWTCTANVYFETPILPGGTAEGDFVLSTLAPGFNTSALRAAGDYSFRFYFWPNACFASPDGTFCLTRPEKQESIRSPELSRRLSAASPVH
ncbi:MAG TPA: hypothetical protein VJW20_14620 [Candidatus Angelobacter sp.]|nr:hypothetical protein [Candidatus Angelobacter sp.]